MAGRSGNRGKCAQGCRLPYELLENTKIIDKGYLLSPKDVCSLEVLPDLINAGIDCFKIEGRMKSPEYVATVTKVYKKYIDMVINNQDCFVENTDKKNLMQVFNRGGFSLGHLEEKPNHNLVFKEKPNHMGIYLGEVAHFNANKGYIKLLLNDSVSKLDTISVGKETGSYTVSELMLNKRNVDIGHANEYITIGRVKGNIHVGDKVYLMSSKEISTQTQVSFSEKEIKKLPISAEITVLEGVPVELKVSANTGIYKDISFTIKSNICPVQANSQPISKEKIIEQLSKTGNTQFEFNKIDVKLSDNLYVPKFSVFNELRRISLEKLENIAKTNYEKDLKVLPSVITKTSTNHNNYEITILLNELSTNMDYTNLYTVSKLYVPLKYFINTNFTDVLKTLCEKQNVCIYMPTITRKNYANILHTKLKNIVELFSIKGFIVSNLSQIDILKNFSLELIGNYTLNIFNKHTVEELKQLGLQAYTISPELDKITINNLTLTTTLPSEIICYGYLPLMNCNYCLLGKSNKCYSECKQYCKSNTYYLKDRMGFLFEIVPDNLETVTTIYNSKITSIAPKDLNCNFVRLDFGKETVENINEVIDTYLAGNRMEGQNYTNGNLNREV